VGDSVTTQTQIQAASNGDSPFREVAPDVISAGVDAATDADERVWIRVHSDMGDLDVFAERWLVITDRRLLIVHTNGPAQPSRQPSRQPPRQLSGRSPHRCRYRLCAAVSSE